MGYEIDQIGFLFDLDGVIVDTAVLHYQAWRRLANDLGFDFSEMQNEELKGVGRMDSLDRILSWGGMTLSYSEKVDAANKKNNWYTELTSNLTPDDALPGAIDFIMIAREKGVKIGLGSASKNALPVLAQLGITDLFDVIVDGHALTNNKPDPEVFLKGASGLDLNPTNIAVFEDAEVGIEAALSGGMTAVGIGPEGSLTRAGILYRSLGEVNMDKIIELIDLKRS
jgi:beta-phosphoglucomutase